MPRKVHYNPERAIHNRVADPRRAQRRIAATLAFNRQIARERAIGIDPMFAHPRRSAPDRAAWLELSREYDEGRHV